MSHEGAVLDPRVGLCSVCRHRRVTGNRRGSRFYLCGRSRTEPRFPRYPRLPMLHCPGFEVGASDSAPGDDREPNR